MEICTTPMAYWQTACTVQQRMIALPGKSIPCFPRLVLLLLLLLLLLRKGSPYAMQVMRVSDGNVALIETPEDGIAARHNCSAQSKVCLISFFVACTWTFIAHLQYLR